MSEFSIKCEHCKAEVVHVCDAQLVEAILHLFKWVPEGGITGEHAPRAALVKAAQKNDEMYHGDASIPPMEEMPFFGSQSWSYLLFCKDSARTFHALLRNVIQAAGLDPHALETRAWTELEAERATVEARRRARAGKR